MRATGSFRQGNTWSCRSGHYHGNAVSSLRVPDECWVPRYQGSHRHYGAFTTTTRTSPQPAPRAAFRGQRRRCLPHSHVVIDSIQWRAFPKLPSRCNLDTTSP